MNKDQVIVSFQDKLAQAKACDVTQADILNARDLEIASLFWTDPGMEAEAQAKLIKHERALEQFTKKAA